MNARLENNENSRTPRCGSGVRAYRDVRSSKVRRYLMRLVFSLMAIAALLAFIGGTFSYFVETGASSANAFTTGKLSLLLGNSASPSSYAAGVSGSFGGSNLMPGAAVAPSTITLKNTGTLTADHVDIKFQNTVVNNSSYNAADLGADIADMSSVIVVSTLTLGGTDLLPYVTDVDHDGSITLNELNNVVIQGLAAPAAVGGTSAFVIGLNIPPATGNGIQGDSVTTVVTFGLFQTAGQHLT